MEMVWALKAHHHAETYFKVIAYSLGGSSVICCVTVKLQCYADTLGTLTSVCLIQGVRSKQVLIYCPIKVNC